MITEKSLNPFVAIVVLNWNLPTETIACVSSLLAGNYPNQRVLVVDNGSTDKSVLKLRHQFEDRIDILETGANLFYAGGNNVGIDWAMKAGADFVLLLNNDTLAAPDMVSWLVRTAQAHLNIGILAPMIYFEHNRSRIWMLGSRWPRWRLMPQDIGRGEIDHGQFSMPFAVDCVTGCAMMVRRAVFAQVGLLDTSYQMYYEDADLCARAQQAGFELFVEPRAQLWHKVSVSANRQAAISRYQRTRYRMRFYRQHSAGLFPWLTLTILWLQEIARISIALSRGQLDLASAGWRGLRDGFREKV